MEKLHNSMNLYVKSLSKRTEGDGKEKCTPVSYLGITMARHGEAFEEGNKFGECLVGRSKSTSAKPQCLPLDQVLDKQMSELLECKTPMPRAHLRAGSMLLNDL